MPDGRSRTEPATSLAGKALHDRTVRIQYQTIWSLCESSDHQDRICAYVDQGTARQTQSSCLTPSAAHHSRIMPSPTHEVESLSAPAKPKERQVAELVWPAKAKYAARSPLHLPQKGKVKFIFNVTKCDKIFDGILRNCTIKLSHTIAPIEKLKSVYIVNVMFPFFITPMIVISYVDKYNRL
jgi:hypothetical protein